MKSFAAIIAALGFVASSAFAETAVKTEYFHQTAMDKNEGTAGLSYSTTKTKFTAAGAADAKADLLPLTLRYERGLSDMFSVGAQLGYLLSGGSNVGGTTAGDSYDRKGMSDLIVYMRGQYGLQSNMSLHYGLDLNASLGKAKITSDTTGRTEQTYQSGGMGLTPYVGMAYAMDANIFGLKLSTMFDLGKRKTDVATATTTTSTDYTGANTTKLALFYETAMMGGIAGAELFWAGTNTLKGNTNGTETTTTAVDQYGMYVGSNTMGLNLYGAFDMNETTTLLANLGYAWGSTFPTGVDSSNTWNLGVAGRFTF